MPIFIDHRLDLAACRIEVEELRSLLASSASLPEATLRGSFLPRANLRAMLGWYSQPVAWPDRVAHEYPLFNEFRCDFAAGERTQGLYAFVEIESAAPNSLFVRQAGRSNRAWSARFEAGYSQIIDWFYKLQVMTDSPDMEARFGRRTIDYAGVLLIGRDQHLRPGEALRLEWRRRHVVVNSKHVVCLTYDRLVDDLSRQLDLLQTR